ncbi:DnrO protein [Thermomonas sp.]|uniref:DnrO protein n=1 Tax=Thermomonas sp. TaxID=1971895 RepID=UPI0035B224F9
MAISTRHFPRPMTLLALCIALAAAGCSERHAPANHSAAAAPVTAQASVAPVDARTAPTPHAHAAHAAAAALPATPWASDAPLRDGMRRMHQAISALEHAEHRHLDAAQTTAAAQQVLVAANDMIANCKLPAAPDAALHGLLATLLTGAAALRDKPDDTSPVASMRDAVALYPRMFEDATWQADTATER